MAKKFCVRLPVSGVIFVDVEAADEKEAIDRALVTELTLADIEEWDTHRYLVQGNVCYAQQHKAVAELIEDDEED